MGLPQTPPGGAGRRTHIHFGYVKTFQSSNWHAWLAGPAHWFSAHTKGKTKPCLHDMTGGELVCERCDLGHGCEVIGYVPLWREVDSKPVMVIVHEYTREVVDCLRLHQRVTVGRGDEQSDGVYCVAALKSEPRFHTTLSEKMKPADLTETLLRVWGLPELVEWYRRTHGAPTAPTPKSDGQKRVGVWYQKAMERAEKMSGPDDYTDVIERLKRRAKEVEEPSQNGKHDPPPKG